MRTPRAIAALLLLSGIIIGTLADQRPILSARRAGDYVVLEGDFHVHAFPGDGALAPWTLREHAARNGLDVFAVTNHNQTIAARLARWLAARSDGPIVLLGQEITNPRYHLIALGLERTVDASQSAVGAIADVDAQGGVAIAAHPTPAFHEYDDDATVAQLDGTEAAHPVDAPSDQELFAAFFERSRRLKPSIAPIGSSDFHVSPALASCRTFIFAREASAAGVIEAIRSGRTVAVDQHGRRYGDLRLIAVIAAMPSREIADTHPYLRRLALALAWIGLAGMLLMKAG